MAVRGKPINVADYEAYAAQHLQKQVYDYYRSGANDEVTLKDNVAAYNRLVIRPRFLVDVSTMDRQYTLESASFREIASVANSQAPASAL